MTRKIWGAGRRRRSKSIRERRAAKAHIEAELALASDPDPYPTEGAAGHVNPAHFEPELWDDAPYVCPGCHAVEPDHCAPGCIDAEMEERRQDEIDRGEYDENGDGDW